MRVKNECARGWGRRVFGLKIVSWDTRVKMKETEVRWFVLSNTCLTSAGEVDNLFSNDMLLELLLGELGPDPGALLHTEESLRRKQ